MGASIPSKIGQARLAIFGFGCNQAFLFTMLYLGSYNDSALHGFLLDRADLLCVLAAMVFTFVAVAQGRIRSPLMKAASVLVRTRALPVVIVLGVLFCFRYVAPGISWLMVVLLEGLVAGVSLALLLCAWGYVFGEVSINHSVPEVFIGSALGAAVCFFALAVPVPHFLAVLYLLPAGSAWALCKLGYVDSRNQESANLALTRDALCAEHDCNNEEEVVRHFSDNNPSVLSARAETEETTKLTGRIFAGTAVFGLATGAVEALSASADLSAYTSLSVTFVLFVLYCAAALQLYGGRPLTSAAQAVLPVGTGQQTGPLEGAYRLAILLMIGGFIAVPLLESVGVSGVSVLLAGYLGVFAVLISLFLIMGHISHRSAARSFSRGFSALFSGEIIGVLLGGLIGIIPGAFDTSAALVAVAGIAVLYAYLFLFTDRDMAALSVVVAKTDRFDEACARIIASAKLSKRESEILPLALRGRTAERMASEFFISKNTVETHLKRIYAKCGVHTRQELIDLAERIEQEL